MNKSLPAGICIALLGLIISLSPGGLAFEENFGLDLLFTLRPAPTPPENILIISIDRPESGRPKVSNILPREMYGQLIDILSARNARAIVLDLTFSEPGEPAGDAALARAMHRAGNVILCEYLERQGIPAPENQTAGVPGIRIEKRILPVPVFVENAALTAPFPLPKIPVRLNSYWTFKKGAGDQYTLPVAALHVYLREMYPRLRAYISRVAPELTTGLPSEIDLAENGYQYDLLIRTLRDLFRQNPGIVNRLLLKLREGRAECSTDQMKEARALTALIMMYGGGDNRYLNFYGPPGTIRTVSLKAMLNSSQEERSVTFPVDLTETIVFVGLSQISGREQSDNFYTVFSQEDGVDINGVEVAATAFANLLENKPVTPLSPLQQSIFLLFWGIILTCICFFSSPLLSLFAMTGTCALYLIAARYFFSLHGLWFPLTIPLLVQAPLAYLSAVLWKLFESSRERRNIKEAFGHYLPDEVIGQLAKNLIDIKAENKIVHGLCLFTDVEAYTSVSEQLDPVDLSIIMNRYYQAAFQPVADHGGVVSDVVGDAMLALWVSPDPKQNLRLNACLAALDIIEAVKEFNQSTTAIELPTRIGIHAGTMMLGNIGALRHYEYTPIGDVVNTASRLEGLNKQLGTRILVSNECLVDVEGLLTRRLGTFLMVGKSKPVEISELICCLSEAREKDLLLCEKFYSGLTLFVAGRWEEAGTAFDRVLELEATDGPAIFYADLCKNFMNRIPPENWDGCVRLHTK